MKAGSSGAAPRSPALLGTFTVVTLVALSVAASPSRAAADDPGGSIAGQFLISDGDLGGGATIDLWGDIGPLRLGGFFSFAALPSDRDWHNRAMMPVGALVAIAIDVGVADIVICGRGGIWGGASQEDKLLVGGVVGGGAYLDVDLGSGIAVGGGAEILGLFGGGDTWMLQPALRLTWGRPVASAPAEPEPSAEGA